MRKVPQITLDEKKYEASEPKARVWREVMKFDEVRGELKTTDIIDAHAKIIAIAFDREEITPERIISSLNASDIIPLYSDIVVWLLKKITEKVEKIPNELTPPEGT